jgi:hypothetical protein
VVAAVTDPATTIREDWLRVRYDILRISVDPQRPGLTFYEVADLKTGVVFWTKQVPRD